MITHIVAVGNNLEIGKANELLWHLPEDLKRFKEITMGNTVVVGSNTYKSIHSYMKGKPFLEGRQVIVISSSPTTVSALREEYEQPENVRHWTAPILNMHLKTNKNELFLIGGQQLYNTYKPDRILLTEVQVEVPDADAYYTFDKDQYNLIYSSEPQVSSSGLTYKYLEYRRKE